MTRYYAVLLLLAVQVLLISLALGKLNVDSERVKAIRAKHLAKSKSANVLFDCDFDTDDCEIEYDEDELIGNTPKFTIDKTLLTNSGYLISDYSSITKPTSDGELCQVPFNLNNKTYLHCTEDNKCHTSSGVATCNSGSFLNGKFSTPEHRNTMYLPVVSDYYEDKLYELSFAALLYCEGEKDCDKSNDVIQVGVYSWQDGVLIKVSTTVKMSDFRRAKSWQKFSLQLTDLDNAYYVEIVVVKDFYSTVKSTTYYGVDSIKIRLVQTYDSVFRCSFDAGTCNFKVDSIDSNYVKVRNMINFNNNIFTDFTSTSQEASNGEKCKIPFYNQDKIRYHCTSSYECETSSGIATCASGRFLGGFGNNSINGFFSERVASAIKLPKIEPKYRLSFYVFMYCDGSKEACDKSTDYMIIDVHDDISMVTDSFRLNDFGGRQGWMRVVSEFVTDTDDVFLRFEAGRFSYSNATVFFGVDEFKLSVINNVPDSEDTTTTRTTLLTVLTTATTWASASSTASTTPPTEGTTSTIKTSTMALVTKETQSNLGVILPAVLIPSLVFLSAAIIGYMFYTKKGCFGKSNKVDPGRQTESIEL